MIYYALNVYLKELKLRLLYIILSYVFVFVIAITNTNTLLILGTYPIIKLLGTKFIAIHVLELFNSVWGLSLIISHSIIFPFTVYHCIKFLSSGMYIYQINLIKFSCCLFYLVWNLTWLTFYTKVLPIALHFFTYWELKNNYLLHLELEARIQLYIDWISNTCNFFSFFNLILISILSFALTLLDPTLIYVYLRLYRKHLIFLSLVFFYIFTPPDFYLQLLILVFISILIEIFFFFSCFKLRQ